MSLGTHLKAPPAQVFDLMILKELAHAETAVACKCAPSLITRRVEVIERHFHMTRVKLLDFASDLKERQTTVKADQYAKKKHGIPQVDDPEPNETRTMMPRRQRNIATNKAVAGRANQDSSCS